MKVCGQEGRTCRAQEATAVRYGVGFCFVFLEFGEWLWVESNDAFFQVPVSLFTGWRSFWVYLKISTAAKVHWGNQNYNANICRSGLRKSTSISLCPWAKHVQMLNQNGAESEGPRGSWYRKWARKLSTRRPLSVRKCKAVSFNLPIIPLLRLMSSSPPTVTIRVF